ncbi:MAG: polysaccharide deacetylase family protein [Bacillota bacterium]
MKSKKTIFAVIILVTFILVVNTGCVANTIKNPMDNPPVAQVEPTAAPAETDKAENTDEKENNDTQTPIDYEKTKPNENGKIMLLMYHGIDNNESEWVRTPDNFRKDLQTLYDKGYRVISLKDYINNNINVEAGFTPVVLTFDDGLLNQFNLIEENGEKRIDPNCAVGIMEEFFKNHPDFGRGASFYVFYPVPFRQKELIKEKYEFLINNGYEIGNHGYNHENLGKSTMEEVQKSLAGHAANTAKYIEGFEVFSLALPYGAAPKGDNYRYVISGEYNGTSYNHRAVLKVGSNPAPAPNNADFDPARLPRIRASEMNTAGTGLYDWLAHFDKKPSERYISDGNPNTISIPEEESSKLNPDAVKNKKVIIYNKAK